MNSINQLYKGINERTISKIIEIDDTENFELSIIEKGILSFHAKWSGQSVKYGNSILKLIDKAENIDYNIFIIDIDTITQKKTIELLNEICHGYFESVWIENGKIEYNYIDNNKGTQLSKFLKFLDKKTKITANNSLK